MAFTLSWSADGAFTVILRPVSRQNLVSEQFSGAGKNGLPRKKSIEGNRFGSDFRGEHDRVLL